MKIKFAIYPLILFLSFVLYSCYSPRNIIKLEPREESDKWRFGQQLVADTLYGITYEVGFVKCQDNNYWFDVSVSNTSNLPITVDPAGFWCEAFDGISRPINKVAAINPETELLEIEKELSRNDAQAKSGFGASLIALGVDVATAAITCTDDNPHNDWVRTDMFGAVQASLAYNAHETANLIDLREMWSKGMLRKTTLDPGYHVNGVVFFPLIPNAEFLRLYFPVDSLYVDMDYKQVVIPVE